MTDWLRLHRLIRQLRSTSWDATTWPIVKAELAKVLRLRAAIARAGWFN